MKRLMVLIILLSALMINTQKLLIADDKDDTAQSRRQAQLRRQAAARRQAQLRRQAAARRQAQLRRQAAARRQAQLRRRQAAARRQAELRRQAAARRQAELRRRQTAARRRNNTSNVAVNRNSRNHYAIVIGQNAYSRSPLSTCINDAKCISYILKNQVHIPDRNIYKLYERQATKARIRYLFSQIARKARRGDLVVFYYSGHGVRLRNTPNSLAALYLINKQLVYSSELARWVKPIKGAVLLLFDSCFSGGMAKRSVLYKPMPDVKLLASSTIQQSSWTISSVGLSRFTYYFQKAVLEGKADANADNKITLREAFNWTRVKMAKFARQNGHPQDPVLLGANPDAVILNQAEGGNPLSAGSSQVASTFSTRNETNDSLPDEGDGETSTGDVSGKRYRTNSRRPMSYEEWDRRRREAYNRYNQQRNRNYQNYDENRRRAYEQWDRRRRLAYRQWDLRRRAAYRLWDRRRRMSYREWDRRRRTVYFRWDRKRRILSSFRTKQEYLANTQAWQRSCDKFLLNNPEDYHDFRGTVKRINIQ